MYVYLPMASSLPSHYRHMCRHMYRHMYRHIYRHMYRHMCRHMYRPIYRPTCLPMASLYGTSLFRDHALPSKGMYSMKRTCNVTAT